MRYPTFTVPEALVAIADSTSRLFFTRWPSTLSTTSPARIPDRAAGESARTAVTWRPPSVSYPDTPNRIASETDDGATCPFGVLVWALTSDSSSLRQIEKRFQRRLEYCFDVEHRARLDVWSSGNQLGPPVLRNVASRCNPLRRRQRVQTECQKPTRLQMTASHCRRRTIRAQIPNTDPSDM